MAVGMRGKHHHEERESLRDPCYFLFPPPQGNGSTLLSPSGV